MFCGNCGKEIGSSAECGFCGYNPAKDGKDKTGVATVEPVTVKPVEIVLKEAKNTMAIRGFIFGFFAWMPIPFFFLSLIFSTVGFARAKQYRSGRVRAILGWVLCTLAVVMWILIIYNMTSSGEQY